jgi:hypothetical protein
LQFNSSLPCKSCDGSLVPIEVLEGDMFGFASECGNLNDDLAKARNEIALLKSDASMPCISCESLLAEIKKLKLAHTTCVDELEHARDEICDNKSLSCSKCSLLLVDDACHTSCDDDDALVDVNDDTCSCGLICTSCIGLESEVLALKKLHDDMSAKLVVHDEMSANLEKEDELLCTTYAKCIEKEIDNLSNMTCGTCECSSLKMRFYAQGARVFVLRVWILAFLITLMLMLSKLLLLN